MSESKEKKPLITEEQMQQILQSCYDKALGGVDKMSPPIDKFAEDYLAKSATTTEAAKKMFNNQIAKCTTSGFITGFGGIVTLPVSIPANVGSVIYVQMRMIACAVYMAGYDVNSDQVQTLVYACLAGVSVSNIVKQAGIKVGTKVATNMIKKIPGTTLTKINQRVGFRLVTKFGSKGIINMGKLVPVVGAVVGGGFDLVETKIIADRAYKWFLEGDFEDDTSEEVIDVETPDEDKETKSGLKTGISQAMDAVKTKLPLNNVNLKNPFSKNKE